MKKKFKIITTIFFLTTFFFINTFSTFAAEGDCPGGLQYEMVSYTAKGSAGSGKTPLFDLSILNGPCFQLGQANYQNGFQFLFDLIIGSCVALAVILFTAGAVEGILTSVGVAEKTKGKERMMNAIIGLLIVLSVWLIVNTINPDLLRLPIFQGIDQLKTRNVDGRPGTSGVQIKPATNGFGVGV